MIPAWLAFCAVCAAPPSAPADSVEPTPASELRMDVATELKVGGVSVGEDAVSERRLEPVVGITPIPALRIWVGLPILMRTLEIHAQSLAATVAGDLELAADALLFEQADGLRHRLTLSPALKAPTAPVQIDAEGDPLPSGLQPGCSSVVPRLALGYAFGQGFWLVQSAASLSVPFVVREAPHRGVQATIASSVVLQPWRPLAFRLGSMWLFEATGADALGQAEESSGGVTGYVSLGMEARWQANLSASAGVDVPVLVSLRGEQQRTPIGSIRVSGAWDLVSSRAPRRASL